MFSPLRSNGDTEAAGPHEGEYTGWTVLWGADVGGGAAGPPRARPVGVPAAASGRSGPRCPRHGPGPDARTDGPRRTRRHAGHATTGLARKPRSGPDARTDGPQRTRRHAAHATAGLGRKPRSRPDARTDGPRPTRRHAAHATAGLGRTPRRGALRGRAAAGEPNRAAHSPADDTTRGSAPPALPAPLRRAAARPAAAPGGGEARPPAAPPAAPLPQVPPRCRRWRPAAVEGGVFVRPPAGAVVRQGRSGRCRRGSSASVSSPPTA